LNDYYFLPHKSMIVHITLRVFFELRVGGHSNQSLVCIAQGGALPLSSKFAMPEFVARLEVDGGAALSECIILDGISLVRAAPWSLPPCLRSKKPQRYGRGFQQEAI
jgi:hypothetical protein